MQRALLREAIKNKREVIKREQEKLNESLTTPLCKSEEAIIKEDKWTSECKDLNSSFEKLPPISNGRKIAKKGIGQSYYVDLS